MQCSACRHQCSVISGTIFASSKLGLSRWFLAMHLLTQSKNNISALELKRDLGVCYRTVWLVKHKLMEVMRLREDGRQLTGRVEIDDAYLGGERSGGKVGRGSENKVSFIAAVQTTEDGQAELACWRRDSCLSGPHRRAAACDSSKCRPAMALFRRTAPFVASRDP